MWPPFDARVQMVQEARSKVLREQMSADDIERRYRSREGQDLPGSRIASRRGLLQSQTWVYNNVRLDCSVRLVVVKARE